MPTYYGHHPESYLTHRTLSAAYYTADPAPDTRPWSTTLKPHYLIAQVVLVIFISLNALFVVLWSTHFFNQAGNLWALEKLGAISQITSTLAQLWTIGPLVMLAWVVQTITADRSIRRGKSSVFLCIEIL